MSVIADSLFYLPGADEGVTQWKAERLQMVNWGGFHGHAEVLLAPGATLLSGASGTGKSTLLDAYIAVMMHHTVPFNGASNDATVGRTRGAEQRSVLSYLRGKQDVARDGETGELADQVLRGENSDTWGALAITFVDDRERRYTVARLFYAPRAATRDGEVLRKMYTTDGALDLRAFERFASGKFDTRAVSAAFPGLKYHESYDAFAGEFFTKLGIGANGDGTKALRLLARIQSGQQVSTVDGLYKTMVLEEPRTYVAADKALAHFKDLDDAHEAMKTEEHKAGLLRGIPELFARREEEMAAARSIDAIGASRTGDTPFALWQLQHADALLGDAEGVNRNQRQRAAERQTIAAGEVAKLGARRNALEADLAGNETNATIERLDADIIRLGTEQQAASVRRGVFDGQTGLLGLALHAEEDYAAARTAAETFLAGYQAAEEDAVRRRDEARDEMYQPATEQSDLRAEQESLTGRQGRMDPGLHDVRVRIAVEAGLAPEDLPFLGELIEVLPDEARWRVAIETVLQGPARVMLVDAERLEDISRIIDPLHLEHRINFTGVDLAAVHPETDADPAWISGKLAYRDSPFAGWVRSRVAAEGTDALCVDGPEQLRGPGKRVTAHGQTRSGMRGAHGGRIRHVIGFTNTERLAEIEARLDEIDVVLKALDRKRQRIAEEITHLSRQRDAHRAVESTVWRDIDPDGIADEAKRLQDRRREILASDDALKTLRAALEQTRQDLTTAEIDERDNGKQVTDLDAAYEALIARRDKGYTEIQRLTGKAGITVTVEQKLFLDREHAVVANPADLDGLTAGIRRLSTHLASAHAGALGRAQAATDALEAVFARYQDRYADPNLSPSVENYPAFKNILDGIVTTGLHARRAEWTRKLTIWSGQDLVPLAGSFGDAVAEIEDRLHPINTILSKLPFGARRERLRIDLRHLAREEVRRFRKELNALARLDVEGSDDANVQRVFDRLKAFMQQLGTEATGKSTRDRLLDVRRHIEITAVAYDNDGRDRATFAALGGKSGGESQELVAFIVGAALRFQLGDDENVRPRFAPVFLDEGFVKADGEFTGRSVMAWKGLGFQLLVGAPYDKFTSLEPHADLVLHMSKSAKGYSAVTALVPGGPRMPGFAVPVPVGEYDKADAE